jgi:carboxyl-terminal processing protease
MTRILIYSVLIVVVSVSATAFTLTDPLYQSLRLLFEVEYLADKRGLDAPPQDLIKQATIGGMVSVLDDYSTWHDRAQDTIIRREVRGHYGGFGIEIVKFDDTTVVWQVFPQSPAFAAGIRMGDRLLAADSANLIGLSLDSVHFVLLAIEAPTVALAIYRPGFDTVIVLRTGRAEIEVATVQVPARFDSIALITVGQFNARTTEALRRALDTLSRAGVARFILDLRGNPGGLLQAAVGCAELFMPREGIVASVIGDGPNEEIHSDEGPFPHQPLVILLDERSASGSELFAGCLQDWDRAVLVGRPTYGKGFVQNLYPLSDGSSLRLTVGRYLTPSGRTFYRPDTTQAEDTATFKSLVNGRLIRGGGRIFPDLEVPEMECPQNAALLTNGRPLFDFAVERLASDPMVDVNLQLVAEFWASGFGDVFLGQTSTELRDLAPGEFEQTRAWREIIEEVSRRETEFDMQQSESCVLRALALHAFRAGAKVPFLEEPLLSTDPALSTAMAILRNPGWYPSALAGRLP